MWRDEVRQRRSNKRAQRWEITASDLTPSLALSYEDLLVATEVSTEDAL